MATANATSLAPILADIASQQEVTRAAITKVVAELAESPRFVESSSGQLLYLAGFLEGLKEADWAIKEEIDSNNPFAIIVAELLVDLGTVQANTATGVNLRQRSPDYISGKVAAVRDVARSLADAMRDAIRDGE